MRPIENSSGLRRVQSLHAEPIVDRKEDSLAVVNSMTRIAEAVPSRFWHNSRYGGREIALQAQHGPKSNATRGGR